jgi:hypothetical protein
VQAILAEALDRLAEWTKNAAAYEGLVKKLLVQVCVNLVRLFVLFSHWMLNFFKLLGFGQDWRE